MNILALTSLTLILTLDNRVTEQILKDGRGLRVKWKPHGGLPGLVAPGSVSDNQD